MKKFDPSLYFITDSTKYTEEEFLYRVEQALQGGATLLQLREKNKSTREYPFFSLLNITGIAKGITIENAKYPLDNAEIACEYQYGVSNEVTPGTTARVTVKEGKLLLIKDRV